MDEFCDLRAEHCASLIGKAEVHHARLVAERESGGEHGSAVRGVPRRVFRMGMEGTATASPDGHTSTERTKGLSREPLGARLNDTLAGKRPLWLSSKAML